MLRRQFLLSSLAVTFARGATADTCVVTPQQFGARARGERFDDAPAIQRAVDYVWKNKPGGSVFFPAVDAFYNVRSPIICRPGVSLRGNKSRIKNLNTEGFIERSVFLPGNFHPDFTEKLEYHSMSPTAVPGRFQLKGIDGRKFRPGTQVFVTSLEFDYTGKFKVPEHGWLNEIAESKGQWLTLRRPIDVEKDEYRIATLGTAARNDIPLFFYSDAEISGFDIESDGRWTSDTATYNVQFRDNLVRSRSAIYGNTFQKTVWENNEFIVRTGFNEQSHNSIDNVVANNSFTRDAPDHESFVGFSFQEFARNILFKDNIAKVGRCDGRRGPLVWFLNASNINFSNTPFSIGSYGMTTLVAFGRRGATDSFPQSNNRIDGCSFEVGECGRFMEVNGFGSSHIFGNYIKNCAFVGKPATEAFRFKGNRYRFGIRDSIWSGGIVVDGLPPEIS